VAVTTETLLGVSTPVTVDDDEEEEEPPPLLPKSLQPVNSATIARTRKTLRALRCDFAI
jgi:hypothetical protein